MRSDRDEIFDSPSDPLKSGPSPAPEPGELEFDLTDAQQRVREHFWRGLLGTPASPWPGSTEESGANQPGANQPTDSDAAPLLSEVARSLAGRKVFLDGADQLPDPQLAELRFEPAEESAPPPRAPVTFNSQDPIGGSDEPDAQPSPAPQTEST